MPRINDRDPGVRQRLAGLDELVVQARQPAGNRHHEDRLIMTRQEIELTLDLGLRGLGALGAGAAGPEALVELFRGDRDLIEEEALAEGHREGENMDLEGVQDLPGKVAG